MKTKLAVNKSVSITIITLGTKLNVISLIDVAACIIPINNPIANNKELCSLITKMINLLI